MSEDSNNNGRKRTDIYRYIQDKFFFKLIPWILLLVYIIGYPFLWELVYAYGALLLVPVFLFSLQGKKYGIRFGLLAYPINTILHTFIEETPFLVAIRYMIVPTIIFVLIGYTVGTIVDLSIEKDKLISELSAKEEEIFNLQGLIPICMYCKDVRDPKGYWNEIETYIQENTSSTFSHGVCETCYENQIKILGNEKNDISQKQ